MSTGSLAPLSSRAPPLAGGGPLQVLSSMATRRWLAQCLEGWVSTHGRAAALTALGGVEAARRLREGEAWDVVVLSDDALDRLVAERVVRCEHRRTLAVSLMAAAVRAGRPAPDLGSDDAARRALAAMGRIGCSTGPSGDALRDTLARWGLQGPDGPTLVVAPPGVPVGRLVEEGEVDLGFQQRSELLSFDTLRLVDPLAPGLQHTSRFDGALPTRCTDRAAAEDVLAHLAAAPCAARLGPIGLLAPPASALCTTDLEPDR